MVGAELTFLHEVVAICLHEVGVRGDLLAWGGGRSDLLAWWGKGLSVGMVGQGRCVASATDAVICHTL